MRKRRIDKKLHRYWLVMEIIDLSQVSSWRKRLFNSQFDELLLVDSNNTEGIGPDAIEVLNKYGLEYTVSKVPSERVSYEWITSDGLIVFEFKARKYPCILFQTGNNPNVV